MPTEPPPLTEGEVGAMLAEYEASTQGKWESVVSDHWRYMRDDNPSDDEPVGHWVDGPNWLESDTALYFREADAVWTAHAHNQIPRLVADWRRLKRIEAAVKALFVRLDSHIADDGIEFYGGAENLDEWCALRRAVEAPDGN